MLIITVRTWKSPSLDAAEAKVPILASVKRKAHGITPMEIHEKPCEGPDSRNAVEAAAIAALNWTRSHTAQFCVGQWGPYGECNRPTSGSCHWKFPLATIINPSQCFHYLPFFQKKTTYNRVRICPLKHHWKINYNPLKPLVGDVSNPSKGAYSKPCKINWKQPTIYKSRWPSF